MGDLPLAIFFYDGDCGLCTRSVRVLMRLDRRARLCFAPIQGETAARCLRPEDREGLRSAIYWKMGPDERTQIWYRSEAILCALIDTQCAWQKLARMARWLPCRWRDCFYDWVADNRQRLFKRKVCRIPKDADRTCLLP